MIIQTLHEFNRHSSIGFFFSFFFSTKWTFISLSFVFILVQPYYYFFRPTAHVCYAVSDQSYSRFYLLFRIEGCLLNHLGELTMYQQSLLASSPQLYRYSWTICRWLQLSCVMAPLAPNCTAHFNLSLWIVQT